MKISDSPHSVIARSSAGPDDHGEFGHVGACHCSNQLSPIFGNATLLCISTNHETADVLQEDEGDMSLGTQLDEVCPLEGRFREKNAVVGNDTDLLAVDPGIA